MALHLRVTALATLDEVPVGPLEADYIYTLTQTLRVGNLIIFESHLFVDIEDSKANTWTDSQGVGTFSKGCVLTTELSPGDTITISRSTGSGIPGAILLCNGVLLVVEGGNFTSGRIALGSAFNTPGGTTLGTVSYQSATINDPAVEIVFVAHQTHAMPWLLGAYPPPTDTPAPPTGFTSLDWDGRDYSGRPAVDTNTIYGRTMYRENEQANPFRITTDALNFSPSQYYAEVVLARWRGTELGIPIPSPSDTDIDNAADYAVMLAHTPEGHLLRCYRAISGSDPATGTVKVGVSRDAGSTWTDTTVNPDAADAAAEDAVPQILVQPDGIIWCCWHTSSNESRCFYSTDDSATWTERTAWELTNCKRPVPWRSGGRLGMVYQRTTDDAWVTVRSDDLLATAPAVVSTLTGIPKGLPQVVTTPGGDLILIYAATGMDLKQRYSTNEGSTWSSETDLDAQGYFPTIADGPAWGRGILTYGPALADVQRSLYITHPWQIAEDDPAITLDQDHGLTTVGTWVGMVWLPNGVLVASAKNRTPAIKTYWLNESADPPTWTEIV